MWSRQEASSQGDGTTGSRTTIRAWSALGDDPANDTPEIILLQSGLRKGMSLPEDRYRVIRSLRCRRESPIFYIIEASFVAEGEDEGENPLEAPPVVVRDFIDTQEPVDVDADGKFIGTVNGEGYDPPLQKDVADMLYTV